MQHRRTRTLFVTLIISLTLAFNAASQSTEFTYQGSLQNGGIAASGSFNFKFVLFDSVAGGTQIGSVVTINNVLVTGGIFAVRLHFGNQFSGANRGIAIAPCLEAGDLFGHA